MHSSSVILLIFLVSSQYGATFGEQQTLSEAVQTETDFTDSGWWYTVVTAEVAVSIFLCLFATAYVAHYFANAYSKPQVVTLENSPLHRFLLKNCAFVSERYVPPIWCFEARMQTVLRTVVRACRWKLPYRKETISLPDGGELSVYWVDNDENNTKYPDPAARPTVIFLPGLTGNNEDDYVKNMVKQVEIQGYRGLVIHYRGLGDSTLKTPKLYCALSVHDVGAVISHIEKTYPKAPLIAVGVSLGGIMLFNYLAETGRNSRLLAGFISSACWNLMESSRSLERPVNWFLFNRYLVSLLIKNLGRHLHILSSTKEYDLDRVLQAKTIRDYDDLLTAKMFGYGTAAEYYKKASLTHKTDLVHTPVISLSAADDPFAPRETLPLDSLARNDRVAMILTSHGGHIGFLEGLFFPRSTLLERAVGQCAKAIFENVDEWKAVLERKSAESS